MAETTRISWTDSTFNPWRGCVKISPGCANCYADVMAAQHPIREFFGAPDDIHLVKEASCQR